MPQSGMNYEGRGGARRHSTWRASHRVPATGLVHGTVAHNGWPAAATESTPASTVNGAGPPCVLNGGFNHWYRGKSWKAAPPRTLRKQGGTASAVTGASAAGGVRRAGNTGGVSAKGAAGRHVAASTCSSEQMTPQITRSAPAQNQWRRKTFRRKKRYATYLFVFISHLSAESPRYDLEEGGVETASVPSDRLFFGVSCLVLGISSVEMSAFSPISVKLLTTRNAASFCPEKPPLPLMPLPKEEDWENEIQEVTRTDWEKNCYGIEPYGPQDVIHFSLRDLTLQQRDTVDLPVTAGYSPAVHHQRPVQWYSYKIPSQQDQYADADD